MYTYGRCDVYRADIAMILRTAFRTARGGFLSDYAHGVFACLILRLVRVRVGNLCVPSR